MTINGERTSEIDLSAATLQFLNIVLEQQSLESIDTLLDNEDPYDYFLSTINSSEFLDNYREGKPVEREDLKTILYTAIYSSQNKEAAHVNRNLRLMKKRFKLLIYLTS